MAARCVPCGSGKSWYMYGTLTSRYGVPGRRALKAASSSLLATRMPYLCRILAMPTVLA